MKYIILGLACLLLVANNTNAMESKLDMQLTDLKNYQVNGPKMLSAGLPTQKHFETLKTMGVTKVIDLIPGDRTEEIKLMKQLDLTYHNIQVEWDKPTLVNFNEYVSLMNQYNDTEGKVLTHCRLNWRGAVFTYLYRVTQLNEADDVAKHDMLDIWQPNETWQAFIDDVLTQ
jgi:protein tyrosine phosphatase (PTP) superfamily phosphohydrolase (DUF442 family)